MDNYYDLDELYHHGILGMKWGVRRYQNKDGSLTSAGQKRRSLGQVIKDHKTAKTRKKNLEKARIAKQNKAKHAELAAKGKLKAKDMTDEELQARINRITLEKQYNQLKMENNAMVSKGKRFLNKFVDSTIDKLAENVTADVAAQFIKVIAVDGANKGLDKIKPDRPNDQNVFTNNQKKK